MNSYSINYATQNQSAPYQNYRPGPFPNPIPAPINNFNQAIPQYISPQPVNMNLIPSGYNPVNILPPKVNPNYQKPNIRAFPPNQNVNIIQSQNFIQNTHNITYNKYQIPKQNNNVLNNSLINLTQNKNQINLGNNLNESKIIDNFMKNSMIKNRENQALHGHPPIPLNLALEAMKSICKISYHYNNKITFGTGFFMKYSDTLQLLITNYHVIYPKLIDNNIQIEIWNNKKMNLNLKGRYFKFLDLPKDITAIEIKTTDEIYKDIQFLNYDFNYKPHGYNIYNNKFIFSIQHPKGQAAAAASGSIINIYNFQFDHDVDTEKGSSGSPIILLNLMMVIGIHKNTDSKSVNGGTFIGEIINEINNDFNSRNNNIIINNNNNYIIGEIFIKDEDVNKKIRIINSYEEARRDNNWTIEYKKELENEEQIKKCEIEINNILMPFSYFYEFKRKGKYIIKYKFKNYLTITNYMFCYCVSLTNLNLSNFNTQNVTNMDSMFYDCKSLKTNNIITKDNEILISFYIDNDKDNDKDNDRCFII